MSSTNLKFKNNIEIQIFDLCKLRSALCQHIDKLNNIYVINIILYSILAAIFSKQYMYILMHHTYII